MSKASFGVRSGRKQSAWNRTLGQRKRDADSRAKALAFDLTVPDAPTSRMLPLGCRDLSQYEDFHEMRERGWDDEGDLKRWFRWVEAAEYRCPEWVQS